MQLELNAPVRDVTVYPDRALVTRQGAVTIPAAGMHEIVLGGLPQMIDRESLRVVGRGASGARLLGVDVSAEFHARAPEAEIERVQGEIERVTRELTVAQQRQALAEDQRRWLRTLGEQAMRIYAVGLARGESDPAAVGRILALSGEESDRITAATLDAQGEQRALAQRLESLQRELAALAGSATPDRLRVTIRAEASEGQLALDVSYLTYAAAWTPRYDARVNVETRTVRLTRQALARQWSGEDWLGAQLALSTARPSGARTLPDDAPVWYVDQRRPQPVMRLNSMAMRAPAGAYAASAGAPMSDATVPPVEMADAAAEGSDAGAAYVFRAPGQWDIPSDGQPHVVGLGAGDQPVELEYVTMPAVESGAHLRAQTQNTTGGPLLAGPLYLFYESAGAVEYVGETELELTAAGAPLKLYLGLNDNITVKRELVQRDTDRGNVLQGGNRRTTVAYRTTVTNRTGQEQRVIVLDRLPLSRHERIKVKLLEMQPTATEQTPLEQLRWELRLAPGEERRIEWRALIESPADMDVVGLP